MSCNDAGDITVWRGNNSPAKAWRFKDSDGNLIDLTGSIFVLTIYVGSDSLITKRTDIDADLVMDLEAGTVTWTVAVDDSRLIPLGRRARYELEQRLGDNERTLISAAVIGKGGDNLDG